MTTTRESKRIDSITIKRIPDYDADTSDLGEFTDRKVGDCAIVHTGEYAGEFVDRLPCECGHDEPGHGDGANCGAPGCNCEEFDRVAVHGDSRLCKYFNPNYQNYKGEPDEDIQKYCLQDYERMRGLDRGDWGYVGVKAEATVIVAGIVQTIHSGGVWGYETDAGDALFRMVEDEELDQLKDQLHAIGFSKRAIAAAIRDATTRSEV